MGDRANVYVKHGNSPGVYLYTHWGGEELPEVVRAALARKQRWSDAPYLARIVFCEMVGDDLRDETGYGISAELTDNEHPIIVLDSAAQTVGFAPEADITDQAHVTSFSDYIEKPATWPDE